MGSMESPEPQHRLPPPPVPIVGADEVTLAPVDLDGEIWYEVSFGTFYLPDGCGFYGSGLLGIDNEKVTLAAGKISRFWRVIVHFPLLSLLYFPFSKLPIVVRILAGVLLVLTQIILYRTVQRFASRRETLQVARNTLHYVARRGRRINFYAPFEQRWIYKITFYARTEREAEILAATLAATAHK